MPASRGDDEHDNLGLLRYLIKPAEYVPVPNPFTAAPAPRDSLDLVDSFTNLRLAFDYESKTLCRRLLDDREELRKREHAEVMNRISQLAGEIGAVSGQSYDLLGNRQKMDLEREKWQLEQELVLMDLRSWRDRLALQERMLQSDHQYEKTKLKTDLLEDLSG